MRKKWIKSRNHVNIHYFDRFLNEYSFSSNQCILLLPQVTYVLYDISKTCFKLRHSAWKHRCDESEIVLNYWNIFKIVYCTGITETIHVLWFLLVSLVAVFELNEGSDVYEGPFFIIHIILLKRETFNHLTYTLPQFKQVVFWFQSTIIWMLNCVSRVFEFGINIQIIR